MSRGLLWFRLPQERGDFKIASQAIDWALVAFDMDNWLREQGKYKELSDEAYEIYEKARNQLHIIMEERGVTTDDIY